MNLLLDDVPQHIYVGGVQIRIRTDFFLWVRFLTFLDKQKNEKAINALTQILIDEPPQGKPNELIFALKHWADLSLKSEKKPSNHTTKGSVAFDFEEDGNIIYCELWEHFPALMKKGISFHEGIQMISILIGNQDTELHHRAFARCGDFSKLSKDMKKYWQEERAKYAIKMKQEDIDDIFSKAFV
jgi:hypothetical protein